MIFISFRLILYGSLGSMEANWAALSFYSSTGSIERILYLSVIIRSRRFAFSSKRNTLWKCTTVQLSASLFTFRSFFFRSAKRSRDFVLNDAHYGDVSYFVTDKFFARSGRFPSSFFFTICNNRSFVLCVLWSGHLSCGQLCNASNWQTYRKNASTAFI